MKRSELSKRAAELDADELAHADLTVQIDSAIEAVGQPGEDSAGMRRTANARLVDTSDEW